MSAARRTTVAGALTGLALGLAACGGSSSDPSADPPASPTSTGSSPTASPPSQAATGRRVDLVAFTARTPHGFGYDNSLAKEIVFASSRDVEQNIEYSDVTVFPGTSNAFAARLSIQNSSWNPKPTVGEPVTIDGARFYHLSGPVGHGVQLDEYGAVLHSRLVKLSFELHGSAAKRRELVTSVLATVHLK